MSPAKFKDFLATRTTWGQTTKGKLVSLVTTAMNWALEQEPPLIEKFPFAIPKKDRLHDVARDERYWLVPELGRLIIENANPEFQKVLKLLRATGARPGEIEGLEACNYKGGRIIYRHDATRGFIWKNAKKSTTRPKHRVIHLNDECKAIVEEEIKVHPTGKVFRNKRGSEWTQAKRRTGWKTALKKKPVADYMKQHDIDSQFVIPYGYRHAWASAWLREGNDIKVCAELLGTSVKQIEQTYGHRDDEAMSQMYHKFMSNSPQL